MSDEAGAMPPRPAGRFKRLWMEFEVEVVDEMALRSYDLHPAGDAQGNVTGLVDMDINERVGFALSTVAAQAWRAAENGTGIRWLGGSGPSVRWLDETGAYAEVTLPRMPSRRDDGKYDDEAP
jgi:hypothetical protein